MKKRLVLSIYVISVIYLLNAQVGGMVWGIRDKDTIPLPHANVFSITSGIGKTTDEKGRFYFEKINIPDTIVVSYVGFVSDTVIIDQAKVRGFIHVYLSENIVLKEILISSEKTVDLNYLQPKWVQTLYQNELQRAPCCNLSESFQTTGSVQVTYADAVSGARQIQFLGLSGKYVQMLMDNVPYLRGAGQGYSLQFIPASWISSIDVSRGAAEVTHGSEGITGQINVNARKPDEAENLYMDLFFGGEGKAELNINKRFGTEKKGFVLYGHAFRRWMAMDKNQDGFMDAPMVSRISLQTYGQLYTSKKWEFRGAIRGIFDERTGGQIVSSPFAYIDGMYGAWKTYICHRVVETYTKGGYVVSPASAWGFIQSYTFIDASLTFGLKNFKSIQHNYFASILFRHEITPDKHEFDAGFNLYMDHYAQSFNDSNWLTFPATSGIFYQHTYFLGKKFTLQAGARLDYFSVDERFRFIPRMHLRYNVTDKTIVRISSGMGVHHPMIFTENPLLFTSNRQIRWHDRLSYERAVNGGIAVVQYFTLFNKDFSFSVDYFHTQFLSQMLIDIEQDTSFIYVYATSSKSFAQSLLAELSLTSTRHFEARTAYQWNRRYYPNLNGNLLIQPLLNLQRALLTFSLYTNHRKWQFDVTLLYYGKSRLPNRSMFASDELPDYSPSYITGYAQLIRNWKRWKLYGGIENLTNYKQTIPVLGYQNPYSNQFESGYIWAPLEGRMFYFGLRYIIL